MKYNRTLNDKLAHILHKDGELRWLFDFVKAEKDLDFLTGENWISVYRGLSRILKITQDKNKNLKFDADKAYKEIMPKLYGKKDLSVTFEEEKKFLNELLTEIRERSQKKSDRFHSHYENRKEGYYQNILSRAYGLNATQECEFVIVDKEAVIGYSNQLEKDTVFSLMQNKFKELQKLISKEDEKRFGKNLDKKSLGGELDFIALDQNGNILLIEYKDGTNTSGIYLSPIQIGFYTKLFEDIECSLEESLLSMLKQKQEIGLISKEFKIPPTFNSIIPILMISNYNPDTVAKEKFQDVLKVIREKSEFGKNFLKNLQVRNFTEVGGLTTLDW